MKSNDKANSVLLGGNGEALSSKSKVADSLGHMGRVLDHIALKYLDAIRSQSRGSFRVKRATRLGTALAEQMPLLMGTPAEELIAGYLLRAQQRTRLATKCALAPSTRAERLSLLDSFFEREALEMVLQLDKLDALEPILRVRRCACCGSWVWSRVAAQKYCSSACRAKHYQTSPQGKQYKRDWARLAYKRNKERELAALRVAQDHGRAGRQEAPVGVGKQG